MSQTSAGALGIAAQITSAARVVAATRVTVSGAASLVLIVYLAIVIISIVAAVKVVSKAGYSPWWVLIIAVPVLNFVMMLVFAFSEWPVEREVKRLRADGSGWSGYAPGPGFPPRSSGTAGPAAPEDRGEPADAGAARAGTEEEPEAQAPPGWYPTPDGHLRYWDGTAWTDHFA